MEEVSEHGWVGLPMRGQPESPTSLYLGLTLLWRPVWKVEIWFAFYVKFQILILSCKSKSLKH